MNEGTVLLLVSLGLLLTTALTMRSIFVSTKKARLYTEAKWKFDEASILYGEAQMWYLAGRGSMGNAAKKIAEQRHAEGDALNAEAKAVKFNPFRKKVS